MVLISEKIAKMFDEEHLTLDERGRIFNFVNSSLKIKCVDCKKTIR